MKHPDRRMPVKSVKVSLEGDYAGWWLDCRINPPFGLFVDALVALQNVDSQNPESQINAMYDLLELLMVDWNFVDCEGKALPINREGLKSLPIDLLALCCQTVQEAVTQVPLAPSVT